MFTATHMPPQATTMQIQAVNNGSAVLVYCDMEGTCSGERGLMKVVHLNMTDL